MQLPSPPTRKAYLLTSIIAVVVVLTVSQLFSGNLFTTPIYPIQIKASTKIEASHPTNDRTNQTEKSSQNQRPNVLFLMTDDMRAHLGSYLGTTTGFPESSIHTPHLDALASRSLLLRRAFAQYALCNPSRTSLLTSRRPDETRVTDNKKYWREISANFTSLPQYFKEQGYTSIGIGKIFHQGPVLDNQDPPSWSEPFVVADNMEKIISKWPNFNHRWKAVTDSELSSNGFTLVDQLHVDLAKSYLRRFQQQFEAGDNTPFFLGVGFKKPHAANICPEKFFRFYDHDHFNVSDEVQKHLRFDEDTLNDYLRAYKACVSFVDSLVGQLMEYLDEVGLANNTIVSFVADHGYHFGEHSHFGKSTVYDGSTRVPMMLHVPGRTDRGIPSDAIVEALDLFPTLVEAAGLPAVPSCPSGIQLDRDCVRGRSFLPLIDDPTKQIKPAAFSQIRKHWDARITEYSIRTDQHRLSVYANLTRDHNVTTVYMDEQDGKVELFDLDVDPLEQQNKIHDPDYAQTAQELHKLLRQYVVALNY